MRRYGCIAIGVILGLLGASTASAVPAFPGAKGYGTETPGGRYGQVIPVTSLADSGPGTLREALTTPGPRIVIFRTTGEDQTITLNSAIRIIHPYITIAGQTASGDGIQIRKNPLGTDDASAFLSQDSFAPIEIDTHDVVIRHLRLRPGPLTPNTACTAPNAVRNPPSAPDGGTCVPANGIGSLTLMKNAYNVVIDHVSMSWASDQVFTVVGATDVTLQWSIVSEGMNYVENCGLYPPPAHYSFQCPAFTGTGSIVGDHGTAGSGEITARLSYHHNAWVHNSARNPQMTNYCFTVPEDPVACAADVVNNVAYNWRNNGFGISFANILGHHYVNNVGNYTRTGPDQLNQAPGVNGLLLYDWTTSSTAFVPNAQIGMYASGNRRYDPATTTTVDQAITCSVWNPATDSFDVSDPCTVSTYFVPTPYGTPPIATSAETALTEVLADAGANLGAEADGSFSGNRDANDQRVLNDIANGTGQIIDSFLEFPGWPVLAGGTPPTDTDSDGMPDQWEAAHCLDPGVADDDLDADGDVYTNIEEYLNGEDPCACLAGDKGLRDPSAQAADTGGDHNGFEYLQTAAFASGGEPGLDRALNFNGPNDRHRYYDYGIEIPPACSVKGIEVRLDWSLDSTAGTNSMSVELSWNGGSSWTAAKTDTVESTNVHSTTLGSSTNLWGRSWTASELANGNFRVRVKSNGTDSNRDYLLDWIPVRVSYAP